jgi:uncharacterized membrane protein YbhN (UPF0104 family)
LPVRSHERLGSATKTNCDHEETPPQRRISIRSLAVRAVLLAALLSGVVFLIVGLVPGAGTRLAHASPGWIAVEIVLELVACAAYAVLFHAAFSYGAYTNPFLRSGQIAVGELGAFAVVPTGVGGPALRVWALMRGGMPLREVGVRSVVHAPLLNFPYVLAALILGMSVVLGVGPGRASLIVALAPLGLVAVSLMVAIGATLYVRSHPGEPRGRLRRVAREAVRTVPDGLRQTPARLRRPGALFGAIGYWAGDCAVLVAAFHAAGGSAPLSVIVLAYMLGQLGNVLPLPGGVGGVEPLMLGVLTSSGVDGGLAAAAIVLYRLVSLGTQAVVGAAAVATLVPALRRAAYS